jgi:hypothetical protein
LRRSNHLFARKLIIFKNLKEIMKKKILVLDDESVFVFVRKLPFKEL